MQYGYPKNAGFVADFESVEKVPKKLTRKKLSAKKLSFWLLLLFAKVFGFFWMNFFAFFNWFIEFCVFWYPLRIFLSKKLFLAYFGNFCEF